MVRLFIVPWLAAGMSPGSAAASAPSATSTIRCEVSTLPPATAAGGRGFTRDPSGATTSIGAKQPALNGTSSGSRQRIAYVTAA